MQGSVGGCGQCGEMWGSVGGMWGRVGNGREWGSVEDMSVYPGYL